MRPLLAAALACAALLGAVTVFALRLLDAPAYDAEAFARFTVLQSLVSWLKWIVGIALLVGAARVARRESSRSVALAILLLPLLLFLAVSWLDWVVLANAGAAYLQQHGRWSGGAPSSASYMLVAYPVAALATLAAAGWVLRR